MHVLVRYENAYCIAIHCPRVGLYVYHVLPHFVCRTISFNYQRLGHKHLTGDTDRITRTSKDELSRIHSSVVEFSPRNVQSTMVVKCKEF